MADVLNFKGVETFQADTGSLYAVLARKAGWKLTFTPKIFPRDLFGVVLRLRVRRDGSKESIKEAPAVFGLPELGETMYDNRAGCEMTVWVSRTDLASAAQIGKIIVEQSIPGLMMAVLFERLKSAGVEPAANLDVFTEYVTQAFQKFFPPDADNQKNVSEFSVAVGAKAANESYEKAKESIYPDYKANLAKYNSNPDEDADEDDPEET